jgi:hypothetical protein
MKRNKYNAIKTIVNGHIFASKKEANRYKELKVLEEAGGISDLTLQPMFVLQKGFRHGKRLKVIRAIKYIADFKYVESNTHKIVIEDVKGIKTPVFRLKEKILKFNYPEIDFRIIK